MAIVDPFDRTNPLTDQAWMMVNESKSGQLDETGRILWIWPAAHDGKRVSISISYRERGDCGGFFTIVYGFGGKERDRLIDVPNHIVVSYVVHLMSIHGLGNPEDSQVQESK